MSYRLERKFVCERLGIGIWPCRELFKASYLSYVDSADVIALLNESRRGREPELDFIPSDIITPEQAEKETGIPAKRLLRWARTRKLRVPPHFHLSNKTIRFRRSSLNEWLDRRMGVRAHG